AVIEMLIQEEAGVGKPCVSGSETRIDGDRAQKHLAGEVVILLRLPIKKATASEVIFVGLDLGSGHRLKAASIFVRKHAAQHPHRVLGDLILDGEDVFEPAVVSIGPQAESICHVRESDGYSKSVSINANASPVHDAG